MPRRQTDKVFERKEQIIEFLKKYGELTTSRLIQLTGLSHSQIFYVLKLLEKENIIKEVKRGKIAYWKLVEAKEA
ncbi:MULTISPECIES: FaeA/PapI family transcriptional regulator [Pyrobaculum]|nr:FaeA/PapI family transcriptional regulator [Pyrobaculum arsenaticum]AFA39567.1 FaeA-like protein [Pyrobaculum oguniense TE7]MCY0890366.1 winged helix-turn-helix transcriptional regulator [Pyrobaculum arsenaticum]NYR14678.1 winged helix-turn-helix transcriptional regulator [Pyrobaculum arsenaticum]